MVSHEILVVSIAIDTAVELVSTALCDCVDRATGESALPNIERSDIDLNLLDGLKRNRLSAGLTAIRARA